MLSIKKNCLTEAEKAEITALQDDCFREDGLQNAVFLSNELNVDRTAPCFYLGYVKAEEKSGEEKLVSFLSVFFPTKEDGEIVAFTHPGFRRRGYFTALCQEAVEDLRRTGIGRAVFAVEPQSRSGTAVLIRIPETQWLRTEYRMEHGPGPVPPLREGVHVLPLTQETKAEYLTVSRKAFSEEGGSIVDAVIDSPTRRGYLLCREGKTVGVFDLDVEERQIFLYGVAVAEQFRCRGYGREIVNCALREGVRLGLPVVLDVDSDNPPALHLYRSCGFRSVFEVGYYGKII
ncbi:MAG: GNAT family N-acetyltransferase [Neglectibacter timonensis]